MVSRAGVGYFGIAVRNKPNKLMRVNWVDRLIALTKSLFKILLYTPLGTVLHSLIVLKYGSEEKGS